MHSCLVDVPEPPILTPTDLKEVMEESTVNLSCSAEAPCPKQPPTISWSNIPESANITTQLLEKPNKTQSVFSYMTFKASYKDHRKNISCTATYPRNTPDNSTVKSTVFLRVLCKHFGVILHFHKHYYVQMCDIMMSSLTTDVSFALKFLQKRLASPSIHLIQSLLVLM